MRNHIRRLREQKGMSQQQLADLLGVQRAAVSKYESGTLQLTQTIITSLCNIFSVSADYILGLDSPASLRIPVMGSIRAGNPSFAQEDIIDYEELSSKYSLYGYEYFALDVKGESMQPVYMPGDRVILRKQSGSENGRDVAVIVGSDEATLKRFYRKKDMVVLQPMNPAFEQLIFSEEDLREMPLHILGIVVELRRMMI